MVDSTSDAIIANPQSIITKLFGATLLKKATYSLDAACEGNVPSVSSDFDIPKTFESTFAETGQYEKVSFSRGIFDVRFRD